MSQLPAPMKLVANGLPPRRGTVAVRAGDQVRERHVRDSRALVLPKLHQIRHRRLLQTLEFISIKFLIAPSRSGSAAYMGNSRTTRSRIRSNASGPGVSAAASLMNLKHDSQI